MLRAGPRRSPRGLRAHLRRPLAGRAALRGTVLVAATDDDVPWWRIVRADGSLAKGARQRALLEAEGVPFRGERVDMRAARIPYADVGPARDHAARRGRAAFT